MHGKQKWQVRQRIVWVDSHVTTVETWGELELRLNASGGSTSTRVPKFLDVEGGGGLRHGTLISRNSGVTATVGGDIITTSGGTWITLNCG